MKKLMVLILILFLIGCNPKTTTIDSSLTTDVTPTTLITTEVTTEITTESTTVLTTVINDEIYLMLLAGQDTVEIHEEWIDAGAKFVLNDEEFTMVTLNTVNTSKMDIYLIVYTYEYMDETYQIFRYVAVLDQTPPQLELNPGIDTIVIGDTWVDSGVIVTDNSLEDIIAVVTGMVDTSTAGTYQITYTATDSSGNINQIIRYVTVLE